MTSAYAHVRKLNPLYDQESLPFISLLCISLASNAQRPTKLAIGQSGCHAYFLCNVSEFGTSFSEDSSVIYTGECIDRILSITASSVRKLKEQTNDLQQAEDVMIQYMDYLKKAYDISTAVGYGRAYDGIEPIRQGRD